METVLEIVDLRKDDKMTLLSLVSLEFENGVLKNYKNEEKRQIGLFFIPEIETEKKERYT